MDSKLNKWREKTDAEKHRLAVIGAVVATVLVVMVWVTSLFTGLGIHNLAAVGTVEKKPAVAPVSPLSSFGQVIGDSVSKITEQISSVKDTAGSVLTGDNAVYVSTTTAK